MKFCEYLSGRSYFSHRYWVLAPAVVISSMVLWAGSIMAVTINVPNGSFESPAAPSVSPYAGPEMDAWQKSAQPVWYDPAQNQNTPWDYLMGQFFNVPFPGVFIENCEGLQASFFFAVPEVAVFQDYDSLSGTNTTPTHAFNASFNVGSSYDLTVGVIGGGGSMQPGVTLELSLYYYNDSTQKVAIASTSITNSIETFPTNTHFVDFQVHLPKVTTNDPWAGKHIGIQILSTVGFTLAGGYWDLDNVRLAETPPLACTLSSPSLTNGKFTFTISSEPGLKFEIQAAANFPAAPSDWISIGTITNVTGSATFTDGTPGSEKRYYRTRQL
jgi:hypothetical protein